ncbi:hypothetical protein IIA15_03780 [candidate division TA06 bacterium]|nr:hypothetical protein [candidate division TA06 bacterium]
MKEKATAVGAVFAAVGASLCCTGPLVLAALGLGGIGFVHSVAKYQNFFIPLTILFLGSAHYFTWRKKEKCGPDGVCVTPKGDRLRKVILWVATGFAVFFLFFPYLLSFLG